MPLSPCLQNSYGGEHGGVCVLLKVLESQREHLSVLQIAAASGCQMALSS